MLSQSLDAARSSSVIGCRLALLEVEHDAEILRALGAQGVDARAMGEEDVMHRAGAGAKIAQPGSVLALDMAEPGRAPWLVEGRDTW